MNLLKPDRRYLQPIPKTGLDKIIPTDKNLYLLKPDRRYLQPILKTGLDKIIPTKARQKIPSTYS